MSKELRHIEPFFGWLDHYSHDQDAKSPFHGVDHNLFEFDRRVYNVPAHPLWDDFGSESLLVKILFADYRKGYAILELFGEWNDLYDNDFRLLAENCLTYLIDNGIQQFIIICENVFHGYFETDDYYQALQEELEDGWLCAIRLREELQEEMIKYGINQYFFWSPMLDDVPWRTIKPPQLYALVASRLQNLLP